MSGARDLVGAVRAGVLRAGRWLGWKPLVAVIALVALGLSPLWGPRVLRPLAYFHVRRVEVIGARFLAPVDVITRMRIDTSVSVWDDFTRFERRVASHPQVRSVQIERRLPGTLVVRITENLPIALTPGRDGLMPVDASGRLLPIDPSRVGIDLPVIPRVDTTVLRLLGDVRLWQPALFDRISDARRDGRESVELRLATLLVFVRPDIAIGRLADIVPVEEDLAKKKQRPVELDFRFRDQVIARLQ